ncbi:uncharacterized protein KY384_007396 [Bacidia gigantensis]|uniref:uncharacterized protein n=1 Tax=Bacidia gigantensis TaxID=2732470 RepID=UPI001D041D80|nr:uncharacterized protein KY384_007396 [Bacidia gigantensis]KAG8528478.1 hypothetical protein KY384_007396 [Bacidia gigantensis]
MTEDNSGVRDNVLEYLDRIANYTGTDLFVLNPTPQDQESVSASFGNGTSMRFDNRLRVAIYGDPESSEHAKTRVLLMIDQIVSNVVLVRKAHKLTLLAFTHPHYLRSPTETCPQYRGPHEHGDLFPPPFPKIYGYTPPNVNKRGEDELYITGENTHNVEMAKKSLRELVLQTKCFIKDVMVSAHKIDSILLDRLDKVRKIMETNGTYVLIPQLGSQRGAIRVQGTEILHVERTIREIMALAGQFYSASWHLMDPVSTGGSTMRSPQPAEIRTMLSDICTNSGTEISFDKLTFAINGSDDAVKAAMMVIQQIPFVKRAQCHIRVKIELANEHKEFVSGKKNGKINKIMGQSNVQIIFDGFNEYNFYIDVCGSQYNATKSGLELVEQEMPASISFHVPDQYHKRIIGIGGQHIQRIMKRYSVFVKFSNAMDRGAAGKEDDDIKIDNVICRTPARNAQALELVKQEIMDMVEKVVSNPDEYPEEGDEDAMQQETPSP